MGLFDWLFPKPEPQIVKASDEFKMLTAYRPVFHNHYGSIYESMLVRSAIEAKARHISKLKVELQGEAQASLKATLRHYPNPWQSWSQFLARCSTILDCTNNLFIVPVFNKYYETIGYMPVLPDNVKLKQTASGQLWVEYKFRNNEVGAVEFDRCAYLCKHQYQNDLFGDSNHTLDSTMDLIAIQEQAIEEAVKNSATYRFMAQVKNFTSPDDLKNERKRFTEQNFNGEGGIILFPNTYDNIHQITSNAYTVDTAQMELIKANVYEYFGVPEEVIQGKATSEQLDAFFNLAIEPFAIALSEAMSRAIYTDRERAFGNHVYVNANRLQYMSVNEKVNMAQQLGDRGVLTINEIRELFNYEPIDDGDVAVIRGEYYTLDEKMGDAKGAENDDTSEN